MTDHNELAARIERAEGPDRALPYRTQDESGTPDSAGTVAWNWIGELAQAEREDDFVHLEINSRPVEGGGKVTQLYRGTTLLAVATTFRDPMNYTVLVRWVSPEAAAIRARSAS
ncbi:hypothetical protein [Blastomonas sp. CCH1-A6]|uniref:hypothetical protein n=1 Tax=Blastomonas sp. CCH1-A6 TaxID=1768762 RepID=UPI00083163B3